ncbi:hypothetical protein GGR19_003275 [Croceicoccus naphthovorans]|nr:hypothetical protein [Croceicoccus naphthovorans]
MPLGARGFSHPDHPGNLSGRFMIGAIPGRGGQSVRPGLGVSVIEVLP